MAFGSLGELFYSITAKDETAAGLDSAGDRFRKIGTIAGTAMTGIGASMMLMTDKARQMNAPLEAMAIQLGTTSAEMRELALEIGNVTFPLEQVILSMDLLARAGMRDTEEIEITATAFDTLGDAVGMSASEITRIMIPAFNAFDLELKDAANYIDIFTHLQRNTTVEMADFSSMLKYIAPDIEELGITLGESAAVMEALADRGIQGTSATREFRTAISAADGDVYAFYEALGLTAAEIATYTERIENADGMTQQYADAMNTQYGFMDKLKYSVSELTLKYGSMLQPVEALGPAMTALGPAMIMISNINMSKIIPSLAALKVALLTNPIFLIATVIAGVVVALVLLEKKFGILTIAAQTLRKAFSAVVEFFTGAFNVAIEGAKSIVGLFGDKLLLFLGPIGLVMYAFLHWKEIPGMIMGALSTVYDIIKKPFEDAYSFITSLPAKFMDAGRAIIQAIIDGITSLINKPAEIIEGALRKIRDKLPFSDAKEGPLSDLSESGKSVVRTFSEGIESEKGTAASTFSAGIAPMAPAAASASSGGDTYGGDTISIGNVNLSKDYDFNALMTQIEAYQSAKRVQRGIRTI